MKKFTLIIAAAVLGMTSCTKDEIIKPETPRFTKEQMRNINDYVDPNNKLRGLGE